jgi:8-oxo-dGTP diphosphatase
MERLKNNMEEKRPKVGLGVYVFNGNKELLLLKRQGAHGKGSWCPPGGHLEFGESFSDCAKRESKEEMGIEVDNCKFIGLTNDIFQEGKHYITIAVKAELKKGITKIMEPDKCIDFGWFSLENLPNPLFLPMQNLIETTFYSDLKKELE